MDADSFGLRVVIENAEPPSQRGMVNQHSD